jgi:SMC interacting uncharacterized protein involved in chromosome segregation
MKIFNGLNSSRPDKSSYQAASHEDYWTLTQEIQKTQEFISNMSQNLTVMPDLDGVLQAAKSKIEELESQLEKLAVPEDVMARLQELEASHLKLDSRAHVAQLAHKHDQTKAELVKSQLQVAKLQEEFIKEVRQFKNQIWNSLTDLKDATQQRLQALETKVEQLGVGVDLQNLLTKLK